MEKNKTYNICSFNSGKKFFRVLLVCVCFLFSFASKSQINEAARYEINAKRIGVNPEDKDALPRSREFIRLDSTYYVGWMFEGIYKYERSADYLGYMQATIPLRKAFQLFEKDYGYRIQNIFSSINYFRENGMLFDDFYKIVSNLEQCYNSIEMPDSTMALLKKIENYHLQRDFFNIGCDRAWLYHRNRFYNSEKHPFLKNSIPENEAMAFSECYKQLDHIERNKIINDYWYGPYHSQDDKLSVYHYLAILHDYNQNYDSSHYYYDALIRGGRVLWSNYANMEHEIGDFADAVQNYSKTQYTRRFALNEPDYYLPLIFVYGGKTKEAIQNSQNKIEESGSTPGFGWYTIALARGYLYDGQVDSCDFYLDKAANFKELHIGTTLTQSQYEFTINLLRIQVIEKKKERIKFLNKGWWYSAGDLFDICSLKIEKMLLEYSVVNALASNPERNKIVYNLFCSETTVSFDESMYLLKDFCAPYFEKKYEDYAAFDTRKKLNKYFRLFEAKFALQNGNEEMARSIGEKLMQETIPMGGSSEPDDKMMDMEFEKLYAYRLMEMLAKLSKDDAEKYESYLSVCMQAYPQLLPFSGLEIKMNVSLDGIQDDEVKAIMNDMKESKLEFTDDTNTREARLHFQKTGDTYKVTINVWDKSRKQIVENNELLFKKKDGVGKELVMRLFGKGGGMKFESPAL
jgi:hypothetical protein